MPRLVRSTLTTVALVALVLPTACFARGGGGGHGVGARSSSGVRPSSGAHRGSGRSQPVTPEQQERNKRTAIIAISTMGGLGVLGGGIAWALGGYEVVVLAFSLRRKREHVASLDAALAKTDFADPASRAALLAGIAGEVTPEDVDGGFSRRLGLKASATAAADRAGAIAKAHEAAAELKLDYAEGGQARAEGATEAAEAGDDRCVVSIVATVPRSVLKGFRGAEDVAALEDLRLVAAQAGRCDGLWVSYVPALEEPLSSFVAQTVLADMWKAGERAEQPAEAQAG